MSDAVQETREMVERLSEIFGVEWDPEVMAYEEPHVFRSLANSRSTTEQSDAER